MGFQNTVHWATMALKTQGPRGLARAVLGAAIRFVRRPSRVAPTQSSVTRAFDYEQIFATTLTRNPDFREFQEHQDLPQPARLIAFYLPQFHPFPQNDEWWGRGFTEWTNVSKSIPQFVGHYQPRLPGELGFYDLRVPEIQARQVTLAKNYGIAAFCFYYYWFGGERLLRMPLDSFFQNRDLDLGFCLCWANENWTRRWDGREEQVLMGQRHSPEDDIAFIRSVIPYFRDRRYVRIEGKPLFLVYWAARLPDSKATAERWRRICREEGIGEIFLAAVQSHDFLTPLAPDEMGFDAAVEFPPAMEGSDYMGQVEWLNPDFAGKLFDYQTYVKKSFAYPLRPYSTFRGVMPGWDNSARRVGRGHSFVGSTPAGYRRWLENAIRFMRLHEPAARRLVFINAWNEWAEAAYLEPDRHFGYAYADATAKALQTFQAEPTTPTATLKTGATVAVVLHLFYEDLWPEFERHLQALGTEIDLFVTCPPERASRVTQQVRRTFPAAVVIPHPNVGRDMAPFLHALRRLPMSKYKAILKLHTKRTPRLQTRKPSGDEWRTDLLRKLAGPGSAKVVLKAFDTDPSLGVIGPAGHIVPAGYFWERNAERVTGLCKTWTIPIMKQDAVFVAGSMFWFRPAALEAFAQSQLLTADFEPELGQDDHTLAHGLERALHWLAVQRGFKIAQMETRVQEIGPFSEYFYPRFGSPGGPTQDAQARPST